jgi:hypothetical protein
MVDCYVMSQRGRSLNTDPTDYMTLSGPQLVVIIIILPLPDVSMS